MARTESIQNNLNPDFSKAIELDYYFEMVQKLRFAVYDLDNDTKSLADDDFLGDMECTLGQVNYLQYHLSYIVILLKRKQQNA